MVNEKYSYYALYEIDGIWRSTKHNVSEVAIKNFLVHVDAKHFYVFRKTEYDVEQNVVIELLYRSYENEL